ncbi:MAG: hypothetical protein IJ657_08210, partial [Acidaminococcaceae bacterium]|nr:hypothetical protein [Acidaminococcaceae bacterium]
RSGLILLELNLLFMMIILVSGIYCNSVQGICKNCKKLLADIEIARAARYTESMLRRELSYNTLQTRLSKDFGGKDQIICQKTFKNVRVYWYLSGNTVYRKTVKENAIGINPFSDPKIQVIDFKTVPLGKQKLGILMTLKDTETGLTRKRTFTLILSNAPVES